MNWLRHLSPRREAAWLLGAAAGAAVLTLVIAALETPRSATQVVTFWLGATAWLWGPMTLARILLAMLARRTTPPR